MYTPELDRQIEPMARMPLRLRVTSLRLQSTRNPLGAVLELLMLIRVFRKPPGP